MKALLSITKNESNAISISKKYITNNEVLQNYKSIIKNIAKYQSNLTIIVLRKNIAILIALEQKYCNTSVATPIVYTFLFNHRTCN